MSLPIALNHGYCSILLQVSPNGISTDEPLKFRNGSIDAVIDTGNNLVAVGQYVWFRVNDNTVVVNYDNATYYISRETDIVFIEDEVVTPP